jgi:folylpolyglutamate synthase/dihydropteroate synthase
MPVSRMESRVSLAASSTVRKLMTVAVDFFDHRRNKSDMELLESHAAIWKSLGATASIEIQSTVKEAFQSVESQFAGANVIIAGSLYLAGTFRHILDKSRGS